MKNSGMICTIQLTGPNQACSSSAFRSTGPPAPTLTPHIIACSMNTATSSTMRIASTLGSRTTPVRPRADAAASVLEPASVSVMALPRPGGPSAHPGRLGTRLRRGHHPAEPFPGRTGVGGSGSGAVRRPAARGRSRRRARRPAPGRGGRASARIVPTWVLTVVSAMKSARGDLGVRHAPADEREHLAFALGELVEARRAARVGGRRAGEVLDEAAGHRSARAARRRPPRCGRRRRAPRAWRP